MLKLLLLSIILACANAEITLEYIDSKPAGRVKNFVIWQYLKQDINSKQADNAYAQVDGKNSKIKKLYLKKSPQKIIKKDTKCKKEKNLLSIKDKECLKLAINPYKTLTLDNKQRTNLLSKVDSNVTKNMIRIQSEPYSQKAYEKYDSNTVLTMFVSTTKRHRQDNLNINLSKKFVNSIFSKDISSWKKFNFIKTVIYNDKLDKLQSSFLLLDGEYINSKGNFLLGLNHLRHSSIDGAIKQFELSRNKTTSKLQKDKSTFWIYQATKDKKYLEELTLSHHINIYTLYANEKLKKEVANYISSLKTIDKKSNKNIYDPFVWAEIMKEIKQTPKEDLLNLAKKYNQKDMQAVQSYIVLRANDFKINIYLMPYDEYLKEVSEDEKALIYALMRQESHLVPSALSRSFALGLMQLMPFVTDDLSKRIKNPIKNYNDMFHPSYNIRYAIKHLKWMEKSLYHPLFTAYAYNGGVGYFRKHLKTGAFRKGKYEPYLSMEMMQNTQSREYGKKVIANYVMYKKILGKNISIINLLDSTTHLKKTDRYRFSK